MIIKLELWLSDYFVILVSANFIILFLFKLESVVRFTLFSYISDSSEHTYKV